MFPGSAATQARRVQKRCHPGRAQPLLVRGLPALSHTHEMTEEVSPAWADLQRRIDDLQAKSVTDRDTIRLLQEQVTLDHSLIEKLQASGDIERLEVENLRFALATCRRIGVAIGVIMTTEKVSQAVALDALTVSSEETNRKLRDVADYVTLTGELPTSNPPK
jgi:ANTAR domain